MATFQGALTDIASALKMNWIDNEGIANSLTQKLQAASNAAGQTRANILSAFVNEVNAQSGKHIARVAAQVLLQDVNSLFSQSIHPMNTA